MSRIKVLPDDVKASCLALVRGYERRRREYNDRRQEVLHCASDKVFTIKDADAPEDESRHIGVMIGGSHSASRTTEDIAIKLDGLESLPETRRMRAVEHALDLVGLDLCEKQRKDLRKAIFTSCVYGRKYPFERLHVVGMERSAFYDRRLKFLEEIAKFEEMI